jgi:hypothetical protein
VLQLGVVEDVRCPQATLFMRSKTRTLKGALTAHKLVPVIQLPDDNTAAMHVLNSRQDRIKHNVRNSPVTHCTTQQLGTTCLEGGRADIR